MNPALFFGARNSQLLWTIIFASDNIAYICNVLQNYSGTDLNQLDCGTIAQFEGQVINIVSMLGEFFVPYTGMVTEMGTFVVDNQGTLRMISNVTNSNYVFITD